MEGFEFKLDKVLKIRNLREEMARNDFAQANQQVRKTRDHLENIKEEQKELYDFLRQEAKSLETSVQARSYLQFNRGKMNQVKDKLIDRRKEASRCQQKFIDKRKKRQVLEKLKEKEYKRFQKEFFRNEQKVLDEIGQYRKEQAGDIR